MSQKVIVRSATGRQLHGAARQHIVVTDRPRSEGGADGGCTSGELLLLAIGSCAAGGLRGYLESRRLPTDDFSVEVFFETYGEPGEPGEPGRRDRIVISVDLGKAAQAVDAAAVREAVTTGGVTGRVGLGSELVVRIPARER